MINQTAKWSLLAAAIFIAMFVFLTGKSGASSPDDNHASRPTLIQVKPTDYKPKAATEASREGERLFKQLNCMACHSLRGVGGTMGPILDGIGAHRDADYLTARLENTDEARERFKHLIGVDLRGASVHVRLRDSTTQKLVAFLLTLPEPPGGFAIVPHARRLPSEPPKINPHFVPLVPNKSSKSGEKLYADFGCAACHSIGNVGGWLGPQLDGVAGRHSRAYIVAHITDSQVHAQQHLEWSEIEERTEMPLFKATADEVQEIADYLSTLPNPKE